MIEDLWLIGIGTGSPAHVTGEGMQALRDASTILLPQKGEGKDDLAQMRLRIIAASGTAAHIVPFDYPVRDPDLPYQARVGAWHDQIAGRWQAALSRAGSTGPVALLVWGDPSLYDSTIRIAERLAPSPKVRVVPGITAIQALTAAHAIPLNSVNGPVHITTGRRLRNHGWPEGADTVVVMLDGECSFRWLDPNGIYIWWGAFLGMPEQVLHRGLLSDVADSIFELRGGSRDNHGWIMDTYLLRKV
ncbi:precorrin-6A synthase (deacetylating) [Roseovarius nanhaiticus]|uniref:Precorrin-6A synthase [deacetylating] n=1 Tax=Roseovarius nanhaiticus TaxID=573024 RepID=A0A1N7HNJ8_9RHOB|nr:precorrin-6A synthase (deacetylating) [Roseovarius nanhaiticus]SEL37728.1 precorrin-6A synthase (deacetylating) [Roseovarius nanhaiticus]SIS26383.1 precorrin-6A synthase (deacetylating) [Roseovarius nanhaiticus]